MDRRTDAARKTGGAGRATVRTRSPRNPGSGAGGDPAGSPRARSRRGEAPSGPGRVPGARWGLRAGGVAPGPPRAAAGPAAWRPDRDRAVIHPHPARFPERSRGARLCDSTRRGTEQSRERLCGERVVVTTVTVLSCHTPHMIGSNEIIYSVNAQTATFSMMGTALGSFILKYLSLFLSFWGKIY